ncbi:T9SS type A sorting domain-containing protein, partial [candidate division WOR-3 bacterium]|nr:T9SS type A sorting domain-containing protein [candidate division WOR-3 bacterium]
APSIVSRGPYVAAPGATRLVDSAGRVIENAIEEDKIYLSELPPGTYFARDGERTITKVVKVE